MRSRNRRPTNRQAVLIVLIACMLAGAGIGVTAAGAGYAGIGDSLNEYLHSFLTGAALPSVILRESVLKYCKLFVFIWLLAFLPSRGLPVGALAATLLLMIRGAAYGFSTAVLVQGYGFAGMVCAALLYLPQSLILIPAYIFAAYSCVMFIQKDGELKHYMPVLGVGIAVSLVAALIDAFIVPGLVRGVL